MISKLVLVSLIALQTAHAQYTAYVKNFRYSPVLIKPSKKGPGFTIENKSNKAIAKFRFGCVKETNEPPSVVFAFTPEEIPLEARGDHSKTTFRSWTPAQFACSNRYAMVAVIEVLFQDGDSWSAPLKFDRVIAKTDGGFIIP